MPLIIAFGHKARNGKDEAIQAILNDIGGMLNARAYGFGDALKEEVNDAAKAAGGMRRLIETGRSTGVFPDWVVFDENAPMDDPLSPLGKQRTLLQWWGTELRRAQDPDYWVKKLIARIKDENPDVALIRDLRFPNEFAAVQEAGGFCVKVVRVGFVSDVPEHYSERALDGVSDIDWDYIISANDGNLEGLRSSALDCFSFLMDFNRSAIPPIEDAAPEAVPTDETPEQAPLAPVHHLNRPWAHRFCK